MSQVYLKSNFAPLRELLQYLELIYGPQKMRFNVVYPFNSQSKAAVAKARIYPLSPLTI